MHLRRRGDALAHGLRVAVHERLGADGARRRHLSAEIPKDGVPRDLGTRARVGLDASERRLAAVEGRRDAHECSAFHRLGFDEGVVKVEAHGAQHRWCGRR